MTPMGFTPSLVYDLRSGRARGCMFNNEHGDQTEPRHLGENMAFSLSGNSVIKHDRSDLVHVGRDRLRATPKYPSSIVVPVRDA